jgi:hypothetical protein
MIAVDTNVLVYAHRPETPFHAAAASALKLGRRAAPGKDPKISSSTRRPRAHG